MNTRQAVVATVVSTSAGLIVLKWEWLANLLGAQAYVARGDEMVTFEYYVGFLATFVLGYVFPEWPIGCDLVHARAHRRYSLCSYLSIRHSQSMAG
jgi:hypothetical protein